MDDPRGPEALDQRVKVERIGPNHWYVQSFSESGIRYTVVRSGTAWGCSCPAYLRKSRRDPFYECKHVVLCKSRLSHPALDPPSTAPGPTAAPPSSNSG